LINQLGFCSQFGFKDCQFVLLAALLALVFRLIGLEAFLQSSGVLDEPLQKDLVTDGQFSAAVTAGNLVGQFERILSFHVSSFLFVCLVRLKN